MDNRDFDGEIEQMFIDGLDNLFDAIAEKMAKKLADGIIEEIENVLDDPMAVARKPLIYMKIAERLQKHVEETSGKVKVEE